MHDWPGHTVGDVPSPALVAAWLTLGILPTERVPLWAAYWLAQGHDGEQLVDLAGLHGDDPHEVRDLLPAALADCGVSAPPTETAAAMDTFTALAQMYLAGKAGARWVVDKVYDVADGAAFATDVTSLPLGRLFGLSDEWAAGWWRTEAELRAVTRQACLAQVRIATLPC